MRLTYICGFAWEPKGTVRSRAFPLAEEMVRRGHEVTLVVVPYDNPTHSRAEFTKNGVGVVNLKVGDKLGSLARIPNDLIRKVHETSPNVLHVFKPKGFAGLAGMWLLLRNQPFVVDCDDWEGWGGWNETSNHSWLIKQFIDFQEKQLVSRSSAVTVASRVLLDRARHSRKDPGRVFYVPNGPTSEQVAISNKLQNDSDFYKQKAGLQGAPVILYAGHFGPADNMTFFCRSVVSAANRPAHLVFIGNGPELPTVRSFFAAYPRITTHFFGILPPDEYAEVVAAADVCAFPYPDTLVYRAKCSARIIDYMLHGKAVVTTAVGQNREYIIHEESGLLTSPGDEAQFAQGLRRVVEHRELRSRLGRNARNRILQSFLWSGSAGDDCERAYQSIGMQNRFKPTTVLAS